MLWIALVSCSAATTSATETPTGSPATATPVFDVPSPALMCQGRYQAGHPLVTASEFSLAGYSSLAVLDVMNPLAPALVCTINYAPPPLQPMQWLSASEFALVQPGRPAHLIDVDVARQSITTIRALNDTTYLAAVSRDRAWLATMETGPDGGNVARLVGSAGPRTLATFPPAGGHGGTIYGFGGPNIEFSPDGSLVLALDYEANNFNPAVANLQVFDLKGSMVFSAAKGVWAVWGKTALYYSGGDGNVYRWVRGAPPAAVVQRDWLEPAVSPDGLSIAHLAYGSNGFTPVVLDTRSGASRVLPASGDRLDPLFVTSTIVWLSELAPCDSCFGGNTPTGKVFAYDLTSGGEQQVNLPDGLAPLAGASASTVT
jgi:hypothetical protein